MTLGKACATNDFWTLVEAKVKCPIPTYVKNILGLRGFDNALSIKTLTDEDIQSLETFARMKMKKYIPSGADYRDYYHLFCGEPESFEILPGHVRMLKEIVKNVDVMTQDRAIVSPASRTDFEMNHSNADLSCKVNCNGFNDAGTDQRNGRVENGQKGVNMECETCMAFIVDGTPEEFYIQLESTQSELEQLESLLETAPTWPVLHYAVVGQMCAALFDGSYYRAIILFSDDAGVTVQYVDYGNKAISTDLRKLPERLQHPGYFAVCCRLESEHGTFSPQLIERFEKLSRDDAYEMKFVSKESIPNVVRLFEDGVLFVENPVVVHLFEDGVRFVDKEEPTKLVTVDAARQNQISSNVPETNGFVEQQFDEILESEKKIVEILDDKQFDDIVEQFDEILDQMDKLMVKNLPSIQEDKAQPTTSEMPKFTEPTTLKDDDIVVVRSVKSPMLFSVQQTKSFAEYDGMMNKLSDYCATAPKLHTPQIGMACAAFYKKDSEWYRAEIVNISGKEAWSRFVDYGIELMLDVNELKEIGSEFLVVPKQVIPCCLLGFETLKKTDSVLDKLEFLTENMIGERRKFRVSVHGVVNDIPLINLVDPLEVPVLDLSMRLLHLTLPQEKFRDYKQQVLQAANKNSRRTQQTNASHLQTSSNFCVSSPHSRLVGQTVLAKIVSVKDLASFQIVICGCETTFEASYHKTTSSPNSNDKQLPKGVTIPVRIEALTVGNAFSVTPLIEAFGETPPFSICNFPFFSANFKAYVMHWEAYNVAYVHSLTAHSLAESLLNQLFEFYDKSGDLLREFAPGTLCAVKSVDENWYRAEIMSETRTEVNVRYVDYGNCELITKSLVKRLDTKFENTPALAVRVYLPLQKVYSDRETSVDENVKLTADKPLDLNVLELCHQNWIVDMLMDKTSITLAIKQRNCCKSMRIDDLKKQIAHIETLQKVSRLQTQKQRDSPSMPPMSVVPNNVRTEPTLPAPATIQNIQPTTEPVTQLVNGTAAEKKSQTKAFISHIDRPDRFYLQISSTSAALDQLQETIQIVAPSLPPLEDFATDTRCIVRYSVDEQWYRAAIIDSDSNITSILFIDYGNTDTITDNSLIKSMNEAFDALPAYAIPCSLPLEAKDRMEWSEESCELLKTLVDSELEFEYVCKGKANNFVKLYNGDRDLMQELIENGYAIKLESIKSGTNCYVSHVNSISDFYIQMESDTDTLEKVSDYLLDVSKFEVMTDVKEGVVCAAKYLEDGLWYRAKILSHKADSTEVCFVDYGNSALTNELRIIPMEIANAPSLAKYCSMVKPKDIQYWSESAERRFVELTDSGAIFLADVISPGKKSSVDLLVNSQSILDEISALCDKYSLSQLENTLQSNESATTASETFRALIVDGTASKFYVQLESESSQLDQLWASLESASTWPVLEEIVVGQMCVAIFEEAFYRAKILSLAEGGAMVHYVDYGNQSFSTDLRKLPENLKQLKHLAICCRLAGTASPQMTERFEKLPRDDAYEMKFVSKESSPAIVEILE